MLVDPQGELIFFQCRSGPFIPTLKFLHRCKFAPTECRRVPSDILDSHAWLSLLFGADPDILPKYQVDRGAIPFVLSGANIMAPGLTSKGGRMDDVPNEAVVAIMAEGKEHALAIGITTMSTEQIRSENKGIAVENTHWLRDGLWSMKPIET